MQHKFLESSHRIVQSTLVKRSPNIQMGCFAECKRTTSERFSKGTTGGGLQDHAEQNKLCLSSFLRTFERSTPDQSHRRLLSGSVRWCTIGYRSIAPKQSREVISSACLCQSLMDQN